MSITNNRTTYRSLFSLLTAGLMCLGFIDNLMIYRQHNAEQLRRMSKVTFAKISGEEREEINDFANHLEQIEDSSIPRMLIPFYATFSGDREKYFGFMSEMLPFIDNKPNTSPKTRPAPKIEPKEYSRVV